MKIYANAKTLQLQGTEFSNLYLRVGDLYLLKVWLTVIGKYISGSVVDDMMIEASLYG